MTAEQVVAAASVVSALAIVVLIWQTVLAREEAKTARDQLAAAQEQIGVAQKQAAEQLKEASEDHERSRREKAIDLLFEWAKESTDIGGDARRFCQKLSLDQIKQLYAFKDLLDENPTTMTVEAKYRHFNDRALKGLQRTGTSATSTSGGMITLTPDELIYIRQNLIDYFNLIEAVLSAWVHNTADQGMIEEQFKFLCQNEESFKLIVNFREASDNACPSLSRYAEEMYGRLTAANREEQEAKKKEEEERLRRYNRLGGRAA
jgi:biopolymer transport protein ExbB/TolQ